MANLALLSHSELGDDETVPDVLDIVFVHAYKTIIQMAFSE